MNIYMIYHNVHCIDYLHGPTNYNFLCTSVNILLLNKLTFTKLARMVKLSFWKNINIFKITSWFSTGKVKFLVTRPDGQVSVNT